MKEQDGLAKDFVLARSLAPSEDRCGYCDHKFMVCRIHEGFIVSYSNGTDTNSVKKELVANGDISEDIVEVETKYGDIVVSKSAGVYTVSVGGVVKHPECTADDAIRVLGHYLNSFAYSE